MVCNSKRIKSKAPIVYHQNAGNVSKTCQALKISRKTFYEWYNNDPIFKESIDDVNESLIDFVESKLMQLITNNEVAPTIFFLKTKGKKRGYIETNEIINIKDEVTANIPDHLLDEILESLNDEGSVKDIH